MTENELVEEVAKGMACNTIGQMPNGEWEAMTEVRRETWRNRARKALKTVRRLRAAQDSMGTSTGDGDA